MHPLVEKLITYNEKNAAMRLRSQASAAINPGDWVIVEPSRGPAFRGLCVRVVPTRHYGLWFDVLGRGRVGRYDAERVSRPAA